MDTLYADVSEFQAIVDQRYLFHFLAIRSNDGTYQDHHFQANLFWCRRAVERKQLAGFMIYLVWEPDWRATLATFQQMVGVPDRSFAVMVDVETWGGRLHNNQSVGINALREDLITWLGARMSAWARARNKHRKRVLVYGNAGDLGQMWPERGDARVVLAAYGANPDFPGKLAHQFSDRYPCPPFGLCDMNSADGYSPATLAAALGLDPDRPRVPIVRPKRPTPRHRPQPATAVYVKVARGDTLGGIARQHHTSWGRLARLNHLPNPNRIYIGETLRVS